jgi:hypothetical protein
MSLLKGQKVRLTCRKNYETQPLVIIRGVVFDSDQGGLGIRGRRFQQMVGEEKKVEKPVDLEMKLYYLPFQAVKFIEVIEEGTRADRIDRRIKAEKPVDYLERKGEE